jgi:hypothetical protein
MIDLSSLKETIASEYSSEDLWMDISIKFLKSLIEDYEASQRKIQELEERIGQIYKDL